MCDKNSTRTVIGEIKSYHGKILNPYVKLYNITWKYPVECSPPGSSVHGILQARTLEYVTISYSRGSSQPRDGTHISCTGRQILYH